MGGRCSKKTYSSTVDGCMDGSLSSIPPWEGIPVASLTLLAELEELAMNIWGGTGLMDELYGKRPWGSYWLGSNINWSWQRDPGLWLVGEIRSRSIFKGLAKGPGGGELNELQDIFICMVGEVQSKWTTSCYCHAFEFFYFTMSSEWKVFLSKARRDGIFYHYFSRVKFCAPKYNV